MTVLVYCEIGNVRAVFDKYWKYMSDDIAYKLRVAFGSPTYQIPDSVLQNGLLREFADLFSTNGLSITSYDLPALPSSSSTVTANRLILEEMAYDKAALLADSIRMSISSMMIKESCTMQSFSLFPVMNPLLFSLWSWWYRQDISVEYNSCYP